MRWQSKRWVPARSGRWATQSERKTDEMLLKASWMSHCSYPPRNSACFLPSPCLTASSSSQHLRTAVVPTVQTEYLTHCADGHCRLCRTSRPPASLSTSVSTSILTRRSKQASYYQIKIFQTKYTLDTENRNKLKFGSSTKWQYVIGFQVMHLLRILYK